MPTSKSIFQKNNNFFLKFEIWLNNNGDFILNKIFPVIKGAGQPIFSDFGNFHLFNRIKIFII